MNLGLMESGLVKHLTKSMTYETLKQVQGEKSGLFYETTKDQFQTKALPCTFGIATRTSSY